MPSDISGRAVDTTTSLTRRLTSLVLTGELGPGSHLKTEVLATRFETSRVPIREALRELAALGLAEYSPNRGFRVATMTAERAVQIVDVRMLLEPEAAARAAQFASPTEIDAMNLVLDRGEQAVARGLHTEAMLAHHTFLGRLVASARHEQLSTTLRPLHQRTMLIFHGWRHEFDGYPGLRRVINAVAARDARAAAEAARNHLVDLRTALAKRAENTPPHAAGAVLRRTSAQRTPAVRQTTR